MSFIMEIEKIKKTLTVSENSFNRIITKVKIFRMKREKGLLNKFNMNELMNDIEVICSEQKGYLTETLKQLNYEQNSPESIKYVKEVPY